MDRRSLLASAAALATGMTLPMGSARASGPRPGATRNVLLLIADDQGLDAGCYGASVRTPHIDALARTGTRFANAYAAVSSCSPSRSVIYTGLYTHQNGMYGLAHDIHNQSLLDGIETIPALLKKAGYATALVGKKHVRPDTAFPYDAELLPERSGVRDVAAMAGAAIDFIKAAGERPFFVTIGYSDPHRAPGGYGNGDWPRIEPVHYDPATVTLPPHLPDLPAVRQDLAAYYESVSRLDSGVGLLLDGLKAAGRDGDTLIIYLSDNGRPFPGAKTNFYDAGLHLPLIIHAPGHVGGAVNRAMVSFIDIVPTILDWTGAAGPRLPQPGQSQPGQPQPGQPLPGQPLPGQSLLALLGTTDAPDRDRIFASHEFHEINQYYPMRAIRTRTHSYIVNLAHPLDYPIAGDVAGSPSWQAIVADPAVRLGQRTQAAYLKRPAEELYDLRSDPDEVVNLVDLPAARKTLDQLRQRLTDWRRATHDPWLGEASPYGHAAG